MMKDPKNKNEKLVLRGEKVIKSNREGWKKNRSHKSLSKRKHKMWRRQKSLRAKAKEPELRTKRIKATGHSSHGSASYWLCAGWGASADKTKAARQRRCSI